MDPFLRRRIGKTSLEVTQLGMGGASLGDMRESIPEAQATATLEAAHAAGIGYFDTSPWYGNGKSELRFGHVLRTKPRDSFVLSTKVGRVHARPAEPDTYKHPGWAGGLPFEPRFDYTRDGVLKSYEMSLARLGLNRVEALLIHDLDPRHHRSEEGVAAGLAQLDDGGGYRALADLKAQGEIAAIGAGINLIGMIPRFLERLAARFLPRRHALHAARSGGPRAELDMCAERGVSVVIGAPYASGILVQGPRARRALQLSAGQAGDHRQGRAHRRRLPAPRRAARRGRPAVPVRARKRRLGDPGAGRGGGGAPQPRVDAPRHPRYALGRARGRGPHPQRRADAASLNRVRRAATAARAHTMAPEGFNVGLASIASRHFSLSRLQWLVPLATSMKLSKCLSTAASSLNTPGCRT